MATVPAIKKHSVSWEKLAIGPAMVMGEMLTGGHFMEVSGSEEEVVESHTIARSSVCRVIRYIACMHALV